MQHIKFINDFKEPRREAKRIVKSHLEGRGEFSFSYIALLLSATIVCTLGLITNSTAVIIGGMIIAPLMWPILRVSFGIALKKTKISYQPFIILIISTLVIFLGAALVAFISPIKQITPEILSRTTPTSLEIFIALAAAVIAALAVTHPKITDSVAGVAVATSLVPPLCASGIGLAYFNTEIMWGSFLLYLTNAVTIMLVSTVIFSFFLFGKDISSLKNGHLVAIVVMLLVVSMPLYFQLEKAVASSSVTNSSKSLIEESLEEYAPNSRVDDFSATLLENGRKVSIRATVLLWPGRTITFEQEKELLRKLETELARDVDLQLVLQDSVELLSELEIAKSNERKNIEASLEEELIALDASLQLNTINAQLTDEDSWDIVASIRTSSGSDISFHDITQIESKLTELSGKNVSINIEIIESKLIGSQQSEQELQEQEIIKVIRRLIPGSRVLSINTGGRANDNQAVDIEATVLIPADADPDPKIINEIEQQASEITSQNIKLKIDLLRFDQLN